MIEVSLPSLAADETAAVQSAIDAAASGGGGRVVLQAGRHRVGGLRLRSGVTLHLEADAVLAFADSYDAYRDNVVSVVAEGSDRACLVGQGIVDCAITGSGTIRAPGRAYIAAVDDEVGTYVPAALRPRVIVIEDCNNVVLSGVRVEDSPMWTIHLVACREVRIEGIDVRNDRLLPNTDGIVVDSCSGVTIRHVSIDTADDGVCLKTTRRAAGIGTCRNVAVRHSRISSQSCALKVGTETFGDVDDVTFEDCVVTESNRALGIFSRDGGRISNVRFARITVDCHETPDGFWGSGEAVTITVVTRRPELGAGAVSNVTFEDITGRMEGAINLVSTVPGGLSNIRLSRVSVSQHPGRLGTARRYDLRPTPADLASPADARGRANAWTKGSDGVVVGLVDYPAGMPGFFASGAGELVLDELTIARPSEPVAGWDPRLIVQI